MARAARALVTVTKRVMATVTTQAIATAKRVVGIQWWQQWQWGWR
jgi:hypothetical protein